MPIYEFYCAGCHRIFSFLSRKVNPAGSPTCPRCGQAGLERRVSAFAISKGRKEAEGGGEDPFSQLDESRLEQAFASMAGELDRVEEDNPRQAAQMMRRLFEAAGMPFHGGLEEALTRMEAGEDPEKVEEEMGDILEEDPFSAPPGPGLRAQRLRRRFLPPTVDPTLYEM